MCDEVYVGSNDVLLKFDMKMCDGLTLELENAIVTLAIIKGPTVIERVCVVDNGGCSYVLKSEDIPIVGQYFIQVKVKYTNGNEFYGDIKSLNVKQKINI